jgi:ribosome maturation factor RimP
MRKIHDLIEPTIRAMGLELWACDLHQGGGRALLRVFIDRENGSGVTLDDCTLVSREIGAILDVEDPIKDRYELEISSPGLNRTLFTLPHFQKYVGSNVKIKLRSAISNRKQFEARIEKIEKDKIFLIVENETITVTLSEIQKANLIS